MVTDVSASPPPAPEPSGRYTHDFTTVGEIDATGLHDRRAVLSCRECGALILGSDAFDRDSDLVRHVKWHGKIRNATDPRSSPGWSDGH